MVTEHFGGADVVVGHDNAGAGPDEPASDYLDSGVAWLAGCDPGWPRFEVLGWEQFGLACQADQQILPASARLGWGRGIDDGVNLAQQGLAGASAFEGKWVGDWHLGVGHRYLPALPIGKKSGSLPV